MSRERVYVLFNEDPGDGTGARNQVDPDVVMVGEGAQIVFRNTRPRPCRIATGATQLFEESKAVNGIWVTDYIRGNSSVTLTVCAPEAKTRYAYCVLFVNEHGKPHENDVCGSKLGMLAGPGDDPGIQIGGK